MRKIPPVWSQRGLTLIEILIAIIVLMIGVVGILALFPSAIKTTRYSVEDTVSATIAESVADALTIAMRSGTPENAKESKPAEATLVHDGLPNSSYTFALPLPQDPAPAQLRVFAHPAPDPRDVSSPRPSLSDVFKLGGTDFIKDVVDDIKKGPDPTETYNQYAFSFTISRVDDVRDSTETGSLFIAKPLYQFAISIYRLPPSYAPGTPPGNALKTFVMLISGK